MGKKFYLVSNNPLVYENYHDDAEAGVIFQKEWDYFEVLREVRDRIHRGWNLLTHPQASNIRPDQTPYKTIIISETIEAESKERSLRLIEGSIESYYKFTDGTKRPAWTGDVLEDFQIVDLAVAESAISGIKYR